MRYIGILLVVSFISLHRIISGCDQGVLVIAVESFLADRSEHGINWSPAETKGQMTFNEATCRYKKITNKYKL